MRPSRLIKTRFGSCGGDDDDLEQSPLRTTGTPVTADQSASPEEKRKSEGVLRGARTSTLRNAPSNVL